MTTPDQQEPGFEYDGRFYPWSITGLGKDLMLTERICRVTGMRLEEFYEAQEEGSITAQLVMIATSLRAGNPDWTVQKIVHIVENLDTNTDIGFVAPAGEDEQLPPPKQTGDVVPLKSTSSDSSPSSTPQDNSNSETSYATPV